MFRFTPNVKRKGFMCMIVMLISFSHFIIWFLFTCQGSIQAKASHMHPFCHLSQYIFWFDQQIHFDLINKYILIWSSISFWFDQHIYFDFINKHVLSFGRAAYKKALPTCTPFCHLNTFLPSSNVKRGPSSLQWWRPFQYYIYQDPTKKIYAVYFAGDKDRDISRHIL